MFRPMRRIVTGLDAEGRSTILHDGPAANVRENPGRPGQGQALMWVTEAVPASNAGTHDGADIPFRVLPPAGGVTLLMCQRPPESQLAAMGESERRSVLTPSQAESGGDYVRVASSHPGMHATNTEDYLVMISGELTLVLETGEVTLRPGDVVIDRGVAHAWENRGTELAVWLAVVIDALPLTRN
jgi:mannose-6-phosphate isomerase-like protein (cupin superfamily)